MSKQSDHISPELERYLALCKRVYERMERDGTWPWKDQDWQSTPVPPEGDELGDTVSPEDEGTIPQQRDA